MPERKEPNPLYEQSIAGTINLFWSRRSFPISLSMLGRREEPYTTAIAADEAFQALSEKTQTHPVDLAAQIIKSTPIEPETIYFGDLIKSGNWDEFFAALARNILEQEVELRDPNIAPELERRNTEFNIT